MAQLNLYYQTHLNAIVILLPSQSDADMDDHLLFNLTQQIKGKVAEDGIIIKIYRLIDYDYGVIDKTNLSCDIKYNVKYECLLCSVQQHLEIICVVSDLVKGLIIAQNGPVVVVVPMASVDTNKFTLVQQTVVHEETKKKLALRDYIKVSVINTDSNKGDNNITAICKLIDMANNDEIKRYKEDQALISDVNVRDTDEAPVFI